MPNDAAARQHLMVLRRLPRTNAVPYIIDSQVQGDEQLIVLSWTDGLDLKQYLHQVRRGGVDAPSVFESIRLVRGLIHGLLQLHHHAQLIHGDLKPENLILTRKPSFMAMIDYGNAWQVERSAFREQGDGSHQIYAAPELSGEHDAGDSRSDQFSVSVILYQLLTGVVPFEGTGGRAGLKRFRRHFENDSPVPSQHSTSMRCLPHALSQELDRVVVKGLQFDPESRYSTPSAWLDGIESVFLKLKMRKMDGNPGCWHRVVDWLASLVPMPNDG